MGFLATLEMTEGLQSIALGAAESGRETQTLIYKDLACLDVTHASSEAGISELSVILCRTGIF